MAAWNPNQARNALDINQSSKPALVAGFFHTEENDCTTLYKISKALLSFISKNTRISAAISLSGTILFIPDWPAVPFFDFAFYDWPDLVSQPPTRIILRQPDTGAVTTFTRTGLSVGMGALTSTITGWETRDAQGNLFATISGLNWDSADFEQSLVRLLNNDNPTAMMSLAATGTTGSWAVPGVMSCTAKQVTTPCSAAVDTTASSTIDGATCYAAARAMTE